MTTSQKGQTRARSCLPEQK